MLEAQRSSERRNSAPRSSSQHTCNHRIDSHAEDRLPLPPQTLWNQGKSLPLRHLRLISRSLPFAVNLVANLLFMPIFAGRGTCRWPAWTS